LSGPERVDVDHPAETLRATVDGLAAGIWRLEDGHLVLCSFAARDEMPPDVQVAFREATARVSLHRTELAIVQAVVTGDLASAEPPPEGVPGSGSPAWLRRFAARRSIALPVRREEGIVGAMAVAFSREIAPEAPERRTLRNLAAHLVLG
jgi:hypothetical protein